MDGGMEKAREGGRKSGRERSLRGWKGDT